jgi:hypothetical protein
MLNATCDSILIPSSPVDWVNVRAVYRKLHDEFPRITEPFGIAISQEQNRDLAHLICAIDSIDQVIDEIQCSAERDSLAESIVDFIAGRKTQFAFDSPNIAGLVDRIYCLRNVVVRRGVQVEFAKTAAQVLFHSEQKRMATTVNDMVDHLNREWRLSGDLTVLVLGQTDNERFVRFFGLCCEMMTVVDMVPDAKADYASGQLSVRPGLCLYLRLLGSFVVRAPVALSRFPKKLQLLGYAAKFIFNR